MPNHQKITGKRRMEKAARGDVKKVEVKGGTYPSIDNFCFWNPLKWKNNLLVPKLKTFPLFPAKKVFVVQKVSLKVYL